MPRAIKETRPLLHKCCPAASEHLTTTSFGGSWTWIVKINPGPRVDANALQIIYCPWCGVKLPKEFYMAV